MNRQESIYIMKVFVCMYIYIHIYFDILYIYISYRYIFLFIYLYIIYHCISICSQLTPIIEMAQAWTNRLFVSQPNRWIGDDGWLH